MSSLECHINGTSQYVALGLWLVSLSKMHLGFLQVVATKRVFLFVAEQYSIVQTCPHVFLPRLESTFVASCFGG